ncbi:MAG: class I SAM-dependent methyltransferase [Patescibacteria group bacterium]
MNKLKVNRDAWNKVADHFFSHSALPVWGPFGIGKNTDIIGPVKGKIFLEIGFGSGHSIQYLIKKNAKKVYGLDISKTQFDFATKLNKKAVESRKVELFETNMEKKLKIPLVDTVFSIYAFGWTVDPKKSLQNVYSYLKPGGKFIWSWDHTFFTDIEDQKDKLVVRHSYHDEHEIFLKNWKGGAPVYIRYRKTATWFRLIKDAGFNIVGYLEPEPIIKKDLSKSYYTIYKAKSVPCSMIWICEKPSQ